MFRNPGPSRQGRHPDVIIPQRATLARGRRRATVTRVSKARLPLPDETLIVAANPATAEWLRQRGFAGRVVAHLTLWDIRAGQTVIGNLPAHLVAEVCEKGARYLHLALDVPPEQRGKVLDVEGMDRAGARLIAIEARIVRDMGDPP
jgi:CRISPR-associated protein Csx16